MKCNIKKISHFIMTRIERIQAFFVCNNNSNSRFMIEPSISVRSHSTTMFLHTDIGSVYYMDHLYLNLANKSKQN